MARCRWGADDWLYLDSSSDTTLPDVQVTAPTLVGERSVCPATEGESASSDSDTHPVGSPVEESAIRTRFKAGDLPLDFQWLRSPEPERLFSLHARPGYLRLYGRESIGSWFEQALVARRQTEWRYRAETMLAFQPEDYQQSAGLVTYYNRTQFHYLAVTSTRQPGAAVPDVDASTTPVADGAGTSHRCLTILSCTDWPEGRLQFPMQYDVALPASGSLWLGVDVDGAEQQFRYSLDGERWQSVGPVLDASLLSDEGVRGEHSNFTGNFVGMCAQDASGQAAEADFAWFEMQSFPAHQGL